MTIREILQTEAVEPPTPEQLRQRAERQRKIQQKVRDERTKSAMKIRSLQSDLP